MVTIQTTCVIRGCSVIGEYFMRRVKRDGTFQEGLMCDEHDQRYGEENLRRLTDAEEWHGIGEGD